MASLLLCEDKRIYQSHQVYKEKKNPKQNQSNRFYQTDLIKDNQLTLCHHWLKMKEDIQLMLTAVLACLPSVLYIYCYTNYHQLKELCSTVFPLEPDISLLPTMDKELFGLLPHKWISSIAHPLLDITAAVPYILHFILPIISSFYIYATAGEKRITVILKLIWCGGWVNMFAFTIQFMYPTAPPWFVETHNSKNANVLLIAANEAALSRVDDLLGITTFHRIYSTATITFGAMPSLHVAWPVVILFIYPIKSFGCTLFYITWISWAALYSLHHYAVDIIAAALIVCVVHSIFIRSWCPFNLRSHYNYQQ
ncbi:uncharacterized protein TRIADDRAFT_61536 [Trichoplax adhaerens]|uniref:Inositolphosphotransferase Aur1/Ipt1 domain-containing protein n=1 Tax=Trichoplax adhaerens TaxID=10228 RepID=B3SB95_TRIAD|nr:hypothetical protein TRIADDRAFT_61536 [Trichoplax adhaerens]EDV19962.1 hypothetical protein TRIADDRAFT_61536 [Trichoplax adhaerens]|eukprot:XP_002117552.1 hypothetical protein TRIADDRAFT_61536 [Trichoplax adhaerens]